MTKLYGTIEEFREGNGLLFAKLIDLNDKKEYIIRANEGKANAFGSNAIQLAVKQRVAFKAESIMNGKAFIVDGKVVVYEDKKKGKDNSGMEIGHAMNAAFFLTRHKKLDVLEEAKALHDITVELKQERSEASGVPITNYDLGASVGHAVLNASKMCTKVADVKKKAEAILDGPVKALTDYIRG